MVRSPELPLIARARRHKGRTAIVADEGQFSYRALLDASRRAGSCFLGRELDLKEQRVAFLVPAGFQHVAIEWGIWRSGGIAVPLAESLPLPELEYLIQDSDPSFVIASAQYEDKLRTLAEQQKRRFLPADAVLKTGPRPLPEIASGRRALILYTSGTTGKPKGVVITHHNVEAQVKSLITAWEWRPEDYILNPLPLNHTHGLINVLTCALWAGATCELLPKFDPERTWQGILGRKITLFMAVPTIYVKLISSWRASTPKKQRTMSAAASKMRLMISGSAPLPVGVFEAWKTITGHALLERYGMTEIGMALSNPVRGPRVPGYVGTPLPGVELRLVNELGHLVEPGTPGEIEVRGPGVFLEYWRKPEETARAFHNGWFRTGDAAVVENGLYRILGRKSVDIIKTGGHKVSALEIEEVLRTHPDIEECAVVGLEDPEWGERIAAALVLKEGKSLTLEPLRIWAKERLAPFKVPSRILVLGNLPRSVMGKVSKTRVAKLFEEKNGF